MLTDVANIWESVFPLGTIVTFLLWSEEDPRGRVVITLPHSSLSIMVKAKPEREISHLS